jgi:hypothetical protein
MDVSFNAQSAIFDKQSLLYHIARYFSGKAKHKAQAADADRACSA